MRTIASLLFGSDAGELLDLITGEGGGTGERGITEEGRGEREAAERVLRSGEWCGSTPRSARGQRRGMVNGDGWI
jgi:hypothetical protein